MRRLTKRELNFKKNDFKEFLWPVSGKRKILLSQCFFRPHL